MGQRLLYAIGGGFLAYIVGSTFGRILFGGGVVGGIMGFFFGLIFAWFAGKIIFENVAVSIARKGGTGNDVAIARDQQQILIFGQPWKRLPILDTATGLFDRTKPFKAHYSTRGGEIATTGIPPLGRSPLNERRMFESLIESARYERAKRNHPLVDRRNQIIDPVIYTEGILVDELPNDDGSISLILVTGLGPALDRESWQQAYRAGIGRFRSAWDETPYAIVKEFRHGWGDVEKLANPKCGVMPLFNVVLDEIIVPGEKIEERHGEQVTLDLPDAWT